MDINNFQFSDGITMSIFAMLVVFLILVLLQMIIYSFKFLPQDLNGKNKAVTAAPVAAPAHQDNDEEDRMVAMLTASALAKEEYQGNVKVKSIKRIG
ncbi:OadG family protein [Proteiniclasticum sp. SCR006]|uniref:OadG family protein n=1 Tax=Proteiniclasticum aestuarii TaxID=2817862 RepID=A0A939H7E5_9CLOT|nr:OadG family transporter subunit [Proteiniclasticum aestuarii]MBO1264516.1 OadG family protein [Proteiniclasticum aestuarii]